ncbi:hypothetical protein BV898_19141 [Hypsibius exemplaris]|uniref:Uncharacterized protein n=1 Tax=Hypsibius exemplaris TaxID=2072580 RepID=A0A9X6RP70_HYPEX|nr:hypothetical protein BV898_19141 [Hypsibius exemplaris]
MALEMLALIAAICIAVYFHSRVTERFVSQTYWCDDGAADEERKRKRRDGQEPQKQSIIKTFSRLQGSAVRFGDHHGHGEREEEYEYESHYSY